MSTLEHWFQDRVWPRAVERQAPLPVWRQLRKRMPHLFRPLADTVARSVLVCIVVMPFVAIGLAYWVSASEHVTGEEITLDQPVPFSHAHHVGGLGLDCRYCHTGVETSPIAGIPPTHTCMTCHSQLYTQTAMLATVRKSLAENKPIHWNKVNKLPGYVYFDHSIHVAKGIGCTTCHGPVGSMPLMRQAAPLTMGWCLDCHRNPAPNMRPASGVFDPNWKFPDDQAQRGIILAHQYLDNKHLTDCSVCHR
jgi:Cytochrome c7 and related cytochrome c